MDISPDALQQMKPETVEAVKEATGWLVIGIWAFLGLIGAGIKVGAALGKGEMVNKWRAGTTLLAGMIASASSTNFFIEFLNLSQYASYPIALLIGLMAMGFFENAIDGKIPFINKFMGGTNATK